MNQVPVMTPEVLPDPTVAANRDSRGPEAPATQPSGEQESKSPEQDEPASFEEEQAVRVSLSVRAAHGRKLACRVARGTVISSTDETVAVQLADDLGELTDLPKACVKPLEAFEGPQLSIQVSADALAQFGIGGGKPIWRQQVAGWQLGRALGGLGNWNPLEFDRREVERAVGAAALAGGARAVKEDGAWFWAAHEMKRCGNALFKRMDFAAAAEYFIAGLVMVQSVSAGKGLPGLPVGCTCLAFERPFAANDLSTTRPCCQVGTVAVQNTATDERARLQLAGKPEEELEAALPTVDLELEESVLAQVHRVSKWHRAYAQQQAGGAVAATGAGGEEAEAEAVESRPPPPAEHERANVPLERVCALPLAPRAALAPAPDSPQWNALVGPSSPVAALRSIPAALAAARVAGADPPGTKPTGPEKRMLLRLTADLVRALALNLARCEMRRRDVATQLRRADALPKDGGLSLFRATAMCDLAIGCCALLKCDEESASDAGLVSEVLGAQAVEQVGVAYHVRAKLRCIWGHIKQSKDDCKRARAMLPLSKQKAVDKLEAEIAQRSEQKRKENKRLQRSMVSFIQGSMAEVAGEA